MDSNTSSNKTPVDEYIDLPIRKCLFNKDMYDLYCLIPSVDWVTAWSPYAGVSKLTIIAILAFLNKRVRIKPKICDGRPGLVLPINFLGDNTNNRLSIAVAFGVIAGNCIDLFSDIAGLDISSFSVVKLNGIGSWEKAVNSVVLVLLYGVINFPIFACLMTDHLLVGAVFGFLYTLMKFIALMTLLLSCPGPYTQEVQDGVLNKGYQESELYESIPGLLCHIYLLVRFFLLLFNELARKCWTSHHPENEGELSVVVAKDHDMIHVRQLLVNVAGSSNKRTETRNWLIRLRDKIYKPRPDFKFSTGMVSTFTVIVIFIYYLTVYLILLGGELEESVKNARKEMKDPKADHTSIDYYLIKYILMIADISIASTYFSVVFTSIFSVLMILHLMKCHRSHVLLSYRIKDFHGNGPSRLVGRSLSYPGYQIAYVGWGYIILAFIMFLFSFSIGVIIQYVSWSTLEGFIKLILPIFVVSICVWIFQYLLGWLVFRDRCFPDFTININNHRLYCVISFFFFFFNILVGFFSSIFRLLKSMFLGVIFLSRIDRTPLMLGYHNWDQGYMSYIGFLNVLKSFGHPVMLVFCQLLLDLRQADCHALDDVFVADMTRERVVPNGSSATHEIRRSLISKTACNRWLVAYTLLKNPDLQRLRKRNLNCKVVT